jgi:hypothetical protein
VLVRAHTGVALRAAAALGAGADAEDVVQQAFAKAYRALGATGRRRLPQPTYTGTEEVSGAWVKGGYPPVRITVVWGLTGTGGPSQTGGQAGRGHPPASGAAHGLHADGQSGAAR